MAVYLVGVILFVITTLTVHYLPSPTDMDHSRYCKYCQRRVPSDAKHCRLCNTCRLGFDHHCQYVNNCVTLQNYNQFFFGLLSLVFSALINIVHISICLYYYLRTSKEITLERLSHHIRRNITDKTAKALITLVYLANFGLAIPLTVLIIFHIYFQERSISTYEFISDTIPPSKQKLQSFCCKSHKYQIKSI